MRHAALVVLTIVCSACAAPINYTVLNPAEQFPPVEPEKVRIVLDRDQLEGIEYEVIARIRSGVALYGFESREVVIERMRVIAGRLGANAMILPAFKRATIGTTYAIRIRYE